MRILVLGAGGTGGYFGGRLAQAGVDVTFLVRSHRAAQLQEHGLQIRSPLGDANVEVVSVLAAALPELAASKPFDLVILSCKAYDLDSAMDAVAPAMHAGTTLLPILNGLRHYPLLDQRFGVSRVLGGLCFISATKGPGGEVLHLAPPASVTFGERDGDTDSARTREVAKLFEQAQVDQVCSPRITLALWTKYTFLTALAAGTCLMRAPVGRIVAAEGGAEFMRALYRECVAVAAASGEAIELPAQESALQILTQTDSPIKASMLRDLEAGLQVEATHIVGDMLHRAVEAGIDTPQLQTAWVHLQAYAAPRT